PSQCGSPARSLELAAGQRRQVRFVAAAADDQWHVPHPTLRGESRIGRERRPKAVYMIYAALKQPAQRHAPLLLADVAHIERLGANLAWPSEHHLQMLL